MIEFQYSEFLEDDDRWSALFVKTSDKDWHMASPNYGTEDQEKIKQILNS